MGTRVCAARCEEEQLSGLTFQKTRGTWDTALPASGSSLCLPLSLSLFPSLPLSLSLYLPSTCPPVCVSPCVTTP